MESRSNTESRLSWPGTFTSCCIYNSDIVRRHFTCWAGTQINVASLSVPEFYSECHDIFRRSSTVLCSSANMTEGLLRAKCGGRSWRHLIHTASLPTELTVGNSQIITTHMITSVVKSSTRCWGAIRRHLTQPGRGEAFVGLWGWWCKGEDIYRESERKASQPRNLGIKNKSVNRPCAIYPEVMCQPLSY